MVHAFHALYIIHLLFAFNFSYLAQFYGLCQEELNLDDSTGSIITPVTLSRNPTTKPLNGLMLCHRPYGEHTLRLLTSDNFAGDVGQ